MIIDIITIFPNFFNQFLETSIIKRARENQKVEINIHDLREYSESKHNQVDDTPYGGGVGMVMMFPPFYRAIKSLKKENTKVIFLTPQGKVFNQNDAVLLSDFKHLILLCGHYEGLDARVLELVDMEISIGDYVLTGGEIPAMIVVDAVTRLLPGVIMEESHQTDSLSNDRLKYPQYTKPEEFEGYKVPDVLLSGHHKNIDEYRKLMSLKTTIDKRPDLIEKTPLTKEELKILNKGIK
ncbi:tRNA (guanosine(37)-N1)-methyltransferase TrmD [Haploplasma axanthum]|uniref:tRNA (guanine-N(1)-)-methyltransferase n=1 Tax=Haploplasma axanthum TaxID=29552 RepID=A0A449BFJ0_HAPAX|nr:tRNA (guanosine(37)-N1)-methyltransferase TrmD [Haploplasma axanthum]VEU81198.1 tRNA (guanine-N(1)-)-methyltransferase [Haploplasma axanthum]